MNIENYIYGEGVSTNSLPITFNSIANRFITTRMFSMDMITQSGFSLLQKAVSQFESFFPEFHFEDYLESCISKDCFFPDVYKLWGAHYSTSKTAIFELITDVICFSLATYDKDIDDPIRVRYLTIAQEDFTKLMSINVNQSKKAQNERLSTFNELILKIIEINLKIT